MKKYTLDKSTFDEVISSCYGYITSNPSQEENDAYLDEIIDIQSKPTLADKWSALLESGIFHDSEGKVGKIEGNIAYIDIDY